MAIVIYRAFFPLQHAHSVASSWSHDILQWNCLPLNAMSGQHWENYDAKQETFVSGNIELLSFSA